MGVHVGLPRIVRDPITRKTEYLGPPVHTCARITALTHGGQVLLSRTAYDKIKGMQSDKQNYKITYIGKFEMPDSPKGTLIIAWSCWEPVSALLGYMD